MASMRKPQVAHLASVSTVLSIVSQFSLRRNSLVGLWNSIGQFIRFRLCV